MKITDLSLRVKLTFGVGAAILLLAFSGGVAFYYLSQNLVLFSQYHELNSGTNLLGHVQSNLLLAQTNAMNFLDTGSREFLDDYEENMANGSANLKKAKDKITEPKLLEDALEAEKMLEAFKGQFSNTLSRRGQDTTATGSPRPAAGKGANLALLHLVQALEKTKTSFTKRQAALTAQFLDFSSWAKMFVAALSALAVFTITAAGFVVCNAITKPLTQAEKFAMAVADGDFDQTINVGQRDEVGKICDALECIKQTNSAVAAEVEGIVARVERGDLLAKGDSSKYNGGFAQLVNGVNTLVGTFENLIGQLPVGVMAIDKERRVQYLNAASKQQAGITSYSDAFCYDLFKTEDCNTTNCASMKCLETKSRTSSETVSRTSTGEYEILYSSIPMETRSGEIAGALELIIDQTEIKNNQRTMLEVASQANQIADRVASTSEGLAAQVEQVSKGAELQQQRVSSTATAMEEMNVTVLEVARNASRASEQSDAAKNKADEGAEMVGKVVAAINEVNIVARQLQTNMEQLEKQADSIGGVMIVISDIADQTNLLALNAAIEAARAGDAGRGFAVVADEVRKLAEKTMEATNKVGSSIGSIQSAASASMQSVESAVSSVAHATELADTSGEALKNIVMLSTESSALILSIATAAEEQSATSEEINHAIEDVNQIVTETTQGMVQSASAVQGLAKMSLELKNSLNNLRRG